MTPRPSPVRYRVEPGDIPAEKAARRLHLTIEQFRETLPRLTARGFPAADPDTGMFDLEAIDLWRKGRNPRLYGLTASAAPSQPIVSSMGEKFRAATERNRRDAAA